MRIPIGEATSFDGRYDARLYKLVFGDSTKNALQLVDNRASLLGRVLGRNRKTMPLGNFVQYAQVGGETQRVFIEPQNLRFDPTDMLHIDVYRICPNKGGFTTQKSTRTINVPLIFA